MNVLEHSFAKFTEQSTDDMWPKKAIDFVIGYILSHLSSWEETAQLVSLS